MIGNLKKYIDKASFMEHIDAKLRQNEPMIIDSFVSNKCNLKCRHCYLEMPGPYQSRFLWQDGEVFLMKLLEWV